MRKTGSNHLQNGTVLTFGYNIYALEKQQSVMYYLVTVMCNHSYQ